MLSGRSDLASQSFLLQYRELHAPANKSSVQFITYINSMLLYSFTESIAVFCFVNIITMHAYQLLHGYSFKNLAKCFNKHF